MSKIARVKLDPKGTEDAQELIARCVVDGDDLEDAIRELVYLRGKLASIKKGIKAAMDTAMKDHADSIRMLFDLITEV